MKLAPLVALVASILALVLATIAYERVPAPAVAPTTTPISGTIRPFGNPPPLELASAPAVAYISLEVVNNVCVPTFKSPTTYTGNGGVVLWAINNVSCKIVDVELIFDADPTKDPTEPKGRQKKIKLPAGDTRILSARIRTGLPVAPGGTHYTYRFSVNNTVYDPEIIIEF